MLDLQEVQLPVDEILVPLPSNGWPAHLFVRSGKDVYAFTKYRPNALKDLTWSAPLALDSESPYSGLAKLPDN